jgi:hypothetical protein
MVSLLRSTTNIQGFQQTINIVAGEKVKSNPKLSAPDLFGGNGRLVLSYCHRGNSTVEISTPADLPLFSMFQITTNVVQVILCYTVRFSTYHAVIFLK